MKDHSVHLSCDKVLEGPESSNTSPKRTRGVNLQGVSRWIFYSLFLCFQFCKTYIFSQCSKNGKFYSIQFCTYFPAVWKWSMHISEIVCFGNETSTGKYPNLYSWFLAHSQSCIYILTKQWGRNWNGNYLTSGIVNLLYMLPYTHFIFKIQLVTGIADAIM